MPKIYARLQEIASNFSKFSGEAPRRRSRFRRSVRYFAPLPFPNSWICSWQDSENCVEMSQDRDSSLGNSDCR